MTDLFQWLTENWILLLIYIFGVYILISILVYFLQDMILFRPEKLSKEFQFDYENLNFQEYQIDVKQGVTLSGMRFKAENPLGVVFYLKGNSRSIKGWGKFAIDFIRS